MYRRRRILVGVLAVLFMALGAWLALIVTGWFDSAETRAPAGSSSSSAESSGPAETGSPTQPSSEAGQDPEDTEDPEASETGESGEESAQDQDSADGPPEDGSCRSGDLQVRADTGSESYAPGFAPMLVMEVENTADYACTADLGTTEQEFVVAHAGATVFSTAECTLTRESLEVELEPGQVEQAHFTWPRSDSSADCTEPDRSLSPGSYELTVSLQGVRSEPHEFILSEG
ncbi:hypothetical protein GCM10009672_10730 [Nesterenkonia lutea]